MISPVLELSWPLIIVELVALFVALLVLWAIDDNDDGPHSVATAALVVAIAAVVLFSRAGENITIYQLIVFGAMWVLVGVAWASFKWIGLQRRARRFAERRYEEKQASATPGDKPLPEFHKWVLESKLRPWAADHKHRLVYWMTAWPLSFLWWATTYPRRFFNWLYQYLRRWFDNIGERSWQ